MSHRVSITLLGLIAVFLIHGSLQSPQCFAASECKTLATDELVSTDDPLRIPSAPAKGALRIATYNVSLHRKQSGELRKDLEGDSEQASGSPRSCKPSSQISW